MAQPCPAKPRTSAFLETGLFDDDDDDCNNHNFVHHIHPASSKLQRPSRAVRFRSNASIIPNTKDTDSDSEWEDTDLSDLEFDPDLLDEQEARAILRRRVWSPARIWRIGFLIAILAVTLPLVQSSTMFGTPGRTMLGAKGRVIRGSSPNTRLVKRDTTNTDVCKRWSHQSKHTSHCLFP